jgi:hypothetical protein
VLQERALALHAAGVGHELADRLKTAAGVA